MKQAALADKPDVPLAILDDTGEPPNKLAIAVGAVMNEGLGRRVKPVQSAICGCEPEIAATVAGEAPHRIAAKTVGVPGIVKVPGSTFGGGVEFVYARINSEPQSTTIVFHQIADEVGAQASGIVRVVLVRDEGVSIIAIEAITGAEPHEAAVILQNGNDIIHREAIGRGEVSKLKVARPSKGRSFGRVRFSCSSV